MSKDKALYDIRYSIRYIERDNFEDAITCLELAIEVLSAMYEEQLKN